MNGLPTFRPAADSVSPGVGFALGDDRFDDVACLPASVWGFDLRPYRGPRVHARRKRNRFGFLAAVCGGFAGALLLQSWAQYERRLEHERASAIARQVDALAPALSEMGQWQTLIDADSARQNWLEALAPRRTRLLRLHDMLAAATRTGVRIVDMQVRQAGAQGHADIAEADASEQADASALRLHIAGLADDADTLARWAADLAAQPGVISVDLDGVHRVEDRRRDPQADLRVKGDARNGRSIADDPDAAESSGSPDAFRLNAFRLTLTWHDPAGKPERKPKAKTASLAVSTTSSAAPAMLQQP